MQCAIKNKDARAYFFFTTLFALTTGEGDLSTPFFFFFNAGEADSSMALATFGEGDLCSEYELLVEVVHCYLKCAIIQK